MKVKSALRSLSSVVGRLHMSMQICYLPPHQREHAYAADLEGKACCNGTTGNRDRPQQAASAGISAAQCRGSAASHHQPGGSALQALSLLCEASSALQPFGSMPSSAMPCACRAPAATSTLSCSRLLLPHCRGPPQLRLRILSWSHIRFHPTSEQLALQVSNLHCCRGCSPAQPPAQVEHGGCRLVSTHFVPCIG